MRTITLLSGSALLAAILTACAGAPVNLGPHPYAPPPAGNVRQVQAKACGFQLLLLIPIAINDRQERAYNTVLAQAGGDYVTDVAWKDEWFYGLVGTGYCTTITATAIRAATVALPAPPAMAPAPAEPGAAAVPAEAPPAPEATPAAPRVPATATPTTAQTPQ